MRIVEEKPNKSYKIYIKADGSAMHTGWKGYADGAWNHGMYKERENCIFELSLKYTNMGKGRSAVSYYFTDNKKNDYQMTMKAFEMHYKALAAGKIEIDQHGWFTCYYTIRKQGNTYTLWMLEDYDTA